MNIIEKAVEKIEQEIERELETEKVAARAPEPPPAASAPESARREPAAPASARREAAAPAPPSTPKLVSEKLELDLARLEGLGFVSPTSVNSLLAEEHRLIKRPLLRQGNPQAPEYVERGNLIIVTSSLPGEGKTFCSINLAMSIAMEVDRTVLLVDADVAKSDVSKILQMESRKGLSSYLSGDETDLSKLILRTNVDKLTLLPSGPHLPKMTELLASEQMERLVAELSARYADRVVVFDSPPLLATSGASVLCSLMGQVVMVVEAVRTPQSAVRQALRRIGNAHNVQFLLNKQRHGAGTQYGYAYGYGYGYGYGSKPQQA